MRMPAEFEPHAATWVAWPHNPETWPGCLEQARQEFAELVAVLASSEAVHVLVQDERARASVARGVTAGVELHVVSSDDSWMRDIGPTFVHGDGGELVAIDWTFNSWGGKYPPWERDDRVAQAVAELAGVRRVRADLVLEGGALEVDGEGTLLATRSSLLGPTRNPGLDAGALEERLHELLGAECVVWLDAELAGDDTAGHIDNVARFVRPGVVVAARETAVGDANHAALATVGRALRGARDARGRRLELLDLPMPPPLFAGDARLPASYANFYVANRVVALPVFGADADGEAQKRLAELFPEREVVGVPSRALVRGLGAIHCLTQQQPAPATRAREHAAPARNTLS